MNQRISLPCVVAALLLAVLAPLANPGVARAQTDPPPNARLYLTWRAPYGQPRATENIMAPCGDSTKVDTLWMTFDPGKPAPGFLGMTGFLAIHPFPGDTLDAYWNFGEGQKVRRLRVQLDPDSVPGMRSAWKTKGMGGFGYFHSPTLGSIRMVQAVAMQMSGPIEPGLYPLARVLVPRPAASSGPCSHPVCIEWQSSSIAFSEGDDPNVTRGQRFVSWNATSGHDPCGALRQVTAPVRSWKPPGAARDSGASVRH